MKIRMLIRTLFPILPGILRNFFYLFKSDPTQCGEHQFLSKKFPDRCQMRYLELGAFHPIYFSNSIYFRRMGWLGISYDPNPDFRILWRIFRRGDIFVNKAVTPQESKTGFSQFFFMERGIDLTSSLIETHASSHAEKFGISYRPDYVPSISIREVLESYFKESEQSPDLMLIDIEGMDNEILKSLCAIKDVRLLPRWIFMETLEGKLDEAISISSEKYELVGQVGPNILLSALFGPNILDA